MALSSRVCSGVAWAGEGKPSAASFRVEVDGTPTITAVEPDSALAAAIQAPASENASPAPIHGQFTEVGHVTLFDPKFFGMTGGVASQTVRGFALTGDRLVSSRGEPIADRVTAELPALRRIVPLNQARRYHSDTSTLCFDMSAERFTLQAGPAELSLVVRLAEGATDDGRSTIGPSHRVFAKSTRELSFDEWEHDVLEPLRRFVGFCAGPMSALADVRYWTSETGFLEPIRSQRTSDGAEARERFTEKIPLASLEDLQTSFDRFRELEAKTPGFVNLVVDPAPLYETPRQALLRHAPAVESVAKLIRSSKVRNRKLDQTQRRLRAALLHLARDDDELLAFIQANIEDGHAFKFEQRLAWLAQRTGATDLPMALGDAVAQRDNAAHGSLAADDLLIDATLTFIALMNASRRAVLDGTLGAD